MELLYELLIEPFLAMGGRPVFFGQVFIGGLLTGVMYALVALGFVLIYKASGVFNFAQGVMVLFAALTLVGLMEGGSALFGLVTLPKLPLWAAIPLTMLVMLLLAFAIEWLILRHMVNQEQIILFMATIGLTFFLEGFGDTLWGSNVRRLEIGIPDTRLVLPAGTVDLTMVIAVFALAAAASLYLVYRWGTHGVRARAEQTRGGAPATLVAALTPRVLGSTALALALIGLAVVGFVTRWQIIAGRADRSLNFFWSVLVVGIAALLCVALVVAARWRGRSLAAADRGREVAPLHYGWFIALGVAAAACCVAGVIWAASVNVTINIFELFAAVLAAVLVIVLALFFQKTRIGRALRAVADDHAAALSVGISLRGIWIIVWAVAGLVALAAGIIWGGKSGVQFSLSLIALKALPVLILGGFTSVPGAIIGGLIIGVGEKLAEVYWGRALGIDAIENWFAYMLALVFLLFRPQGLFGEKVIRRV